MSNVLVQGVVQGRWGSTGVDQTIEDHRRNGPRPRDGPKKVRTSLFHKMNRNAYNHPPQRNDGLNLNNLAERHPENAPPNTQGLVNLGSGRMLHEGRSSRCQEMTELIQGLTAQIIGSVIDQLKERVLHLMGETPACHH
ncbi:hypothetical protein LIER_33102 [Lithospermum erythrorhizon]|uniref:Uncharacterized protein n=1 Tax=Lithospermum erythrorhizon TaxID=34254 RepID=A0AAV3RWM8_LITER